MTLTTCYDILKVSPRANDEDVRKAYRAQAMIWHPDVNPRNRQYAYLVFHQVARAYIILKTQPRRDAYNRVLLKYLRSHNPRHIIPGKAMSVKGKKIGFAQIVARKAANG